MWQFSCVSVGMSYSGGVRPEVPRDLPLGRAPPSVAIITADGGWLIMPVRPDRVQSLGRGVFAAGLVPRDLVGAVRFLGAVRLAA